MEGSGSWSIFPFEVAYCGGVSYLILVIGSQVEHT